MSNHISPYLFKDITETNNLYSVNVQGVVVNNATGKQLKPRIDVNGYVVYTLQTSSGKANRRTMFQHRLVLQYFGSPNTYNLPCVNHIDGNKANNALHNLEWCTHSDNMLHSTHVLNNPKPPNHKGKLGALSKLSQKVKATNLESGEVLMFEGTRDAERVSNRLFKQSNISACILGKYKQYKGFKWEYV